MGLFRRKKQIEQAKDQLRGKIRLWFRDRERFLAEYLNQKTRGLSFRRWLMMLTGFCLIVGSYLGYLLIGIFN